MAEKRGSQQGEHSVFRIPPYHYIHVLDQTSNVTRIGENMYSLFVKLQKINLHHKYCEK